MFGSPNRLGSSGFVQMPAFGGLDSTPTQTNPFGSATQPSQPAFGSSIFGSDTPFYERLGVYEGLRYDPWKFSVVSYPAKTEEDGGTSGQTAKLESISAMPRFDSCVAIAGADCCVIAADYTCYHHTKISQVTEKSVMASSGLQADVNALQEALSNLIDKHQHNKPMSCPEVDRLLSNVFYTKYLYPPFTVLAGFDREGKGCVYTHVGVFPKNEMPGYISREEIIIPPILKYKLPDEDVIARLSETEAVNLVKTIFTSTTCTGDKLEIVVLNASGLHREYMDLRKKD